MSLTTLEWVDGDCYEVMPDGSRTRIHTPDPENRVTELTEADMEAILDGEQAARNFEWDNDDETTFMDKYDAWLARRVEQEEAEKKAAQAGKLLGPGPSREKTEPQSNRYTQKDRWSMKLYEGIDRTKWRLTWWWLVKFSHSDGFHKETKWDLEYGPGKKYKNWMEWNAAQNQEWTSDFRKKHGHHRRDGG